VGCLVGASGGYCFEGVDYCDYLVGKGDLFIGEFDWVFCVVVVFVVLYDFGELGFELVCEWLCELGVGGWVCLYDLLFVVVEGVGFVEDVGIDFEFVDVVD